VAGYIKLHRSLKDHLLWTDDPFSRGQAWVDLIMLANFKQTSFRKRGIRVIVERGQVAYSTKGLADRWHWSRPKVDRYLTELTAVHQIVHQKTNLTTLITIVNYEKYQEESAPKRAPNVHQTCTLEEGKEGKEEKTNKDQQPNAKKKPKTNGIDYSKLSPLIPKEAAIGFVDHRKLLKSPLTQRAFDQAMRAALKAPEIGLTPEQAIDETVQAGWKKIDIEWLRNRMAKNGNNSYRQKSQSEINNEFTDKLFGRSAGPNDEGNIRSIVDGSAEESGGCDESVIDMGAFNQLFKF